VPELDRNAYVRVKCEHCREAGSLALFSGTVRRIGVVWKGGPMLSLLAIVFRKSQCTKLAFAFAYAQTLEGRWWHQPEVIQGLQK